mmetsp:Transcript_27277/g.78350  ORF Transcript_27277/g.78350 Transcript_27277/m.78350 type:complete len:221 (-) Transcript_27277:495-1157(-)
MLGDVTSSLAEEHVRDVAGLLHRVEHVGNADGAHLRYPLEEHGVVEGENVEELSASKTSTWTDHSSRTLALAPVAKLPEGDVLTVVEVPRLELDVLLHGSLCQNLVESCRRMCQGLHPHQEVAALHAVHHVDGRFLWHVLLWSCRCHLLPNLAPLLPREPLLLQLLELLRGLRREGGLRELLWLLGILLLLLRLLLRRRGLLPNAAGVPGLLWRDLWLVI